MRLIDATDLIRRVLEERDKIMSAIPNFEYAAANPERYRQAMHGGLRKALRCIEESPTIDAEPVRHGRWIENDGVWKNGTTGERVTLLQASCCGSYYMYGPYKHCPNCGAKMRGDVNAAD